MRLTVHMGWQIEPRSFEADSDCWWPRALVSIFEGRRLCTHDVRALLSVTFDTAHEANEYAIRVAKLPTLYISNRSCRDPNESQAYSQASLSRRKRSGAASSWATK